MPYLTRSDLVPSSTRAWNRTGIWGAPYGSNPWGYTSDSGTFTRPSVQTKEGELYTEYGRKTDHLCSNYQRETVYNEGQVTYSRSAPTVSNPSVNYTKFVTNAVDRCYVSYVGDSLSKNTWGAYGTNGLDDLMPGTEDWFQPFVDEAIFALLPGIKPELSLPNALFELKDLGKLPELISKFKFASRSLVKRKSNVARGRRQTLKMITGLSSEAYLTDQFAIRPLLGDIMSIINAMKSYQKQLERLLRDEGKIRKAHWVKPISAETDLLPLGEIQWSTTDGTWYQGNLHRRSVTYPEVPTFRAQLVYRYNLLPFAKTMAQVFGPMDALGINLNPAHVWNAIPFTFIVDWIVNIGDFLDRRQMRLIEPITDIIRFSWSYNVRRQTEFFSEFAVDGPEGSGEYHVGTTTEAFYYRKPGIPTYDRFLKVTGLTLHNISIGGAMVGATRSRR